MKADHKTDSAFADVPSRVDVDELELEQMAYWEKEKIFEQSLEQSRDKELFLFYDGPPYATGKPHYGHILQSAIKDTVLRYKAMRGYYVPRHVGWDCHGLPVETLVEKELGLAAKKDIEEYGIEKFNQKCREVVLRYVDDFTNTLKRLGRWADYDNAYMTLDRDYMESEWWVFKQLWDQELVYQAFRSTPYCIRCETPLSNFEVATSYKETTDLAVYVMLDVSPTSLPKELSPSAPGSGRTGRGADKKQKLLIWTTTPWTLPGNVAVAVSNSLEYVSIDHAGADVIVARARAVEIFGDEAHVTREWSVKELLQLKYEPLYQLTDDERAYRVVVADHVTAEEGTGLVHMAPAFGADDFEVGKKNGLPTLRTVDQQGRFTEEVAKWQGERVLDAGPGIATDLEERGLLFKQEQHRHSYPFCWRCDTALIYYALDTWFVNIGELKNSMRAHAEQISWTPAHVKSGRFGKGIESAPDWAVSRNRYWSVPLPVWQCGDCEESVCVGSVAELQKLSGQKSIEDLHRPFVDDITWSCKTCDQGQMKRTPEVLDVWFDSGSMPYSQWHYPFENKDFVESSFPADFIVEAIEQTRLWFYTLHVIATALTRKDIGLGKGKPAYKNALGSGLIMDAKGRKLSKKLKNYVEPEVMMKKYGADVFRLYFLTGSTPGEPYRFSEKELQHLQRNTYMTLWNVYSFFVRYANVADYKLKIDDLKFKNTAELSLLDKWILARTSHLESNVMAALDEYKVDQAARFLVPFVDDLSNWYVRRSRHRFQQPESDSARESSFGTLHQVLIRLSKLMAPFAPFVADTMYRNLTAAKSVHLESLDEPPKLTDGDLKLVDTMSQVRATVTEGLALRAGAQIKVRQPLEELVLVGKRLGDEFESLIIDELNVKKLTFADVLPSDDAYIKSDDGRVQLALNTKISDTLRREGLAREIIRHGQVLRREASFALDDRITLIFRSDNAELQAVVDDHQEMIRDALLADYIETNKKSGSEDVGADLDIGDAKVHLGVRK